MQKDSIKDMAQIVVKAVEVLSREGVTPEEIVREVGSGLSKVRLTKGERLAIYPALEKAGIKTVRDQAETLGVGHGTVGRDKAPPVPKGTHTVPDSVPNGTQGPAPTKSGFVKIQVVDNITKFTQGLWQLQGTEFQDDPLIRDCYKEAADEVYIWLEGGDKP